MKYLFMLSLILVVITGIIGCSSTEKEPFVTVSLVETLNEDFMTDNGEKYSTIYYTNPHDTTLFEAEDNPLSNNSNMIKCDEIQVKFNYENNSVIKVTEDNGLTFIWIEQIILYKE